MMYRIRPFFFIINPPVFLDNPNSPDKSTMKTRTENKPKDVKTILSQPNITSSSSCKWILIKPKHTPQVFLLIYYVKICQNISKKMLKGPFSVQTPVRPNVLFTRINFIQSKNSMRSHPNGSIKYTNNFI